MSRYRYIIDSGHGGEAWGVYLTDGKRSPEVPPGFYEGVYNRQIASFLAARLRHDGMEAEHINSGAANCRETEKADAANRLEAKLKNCVYVAIHCNAAPGKGWQPAKGSCVFIAPKRVPQTAFIARKTYAAERAMATVFENHLASIPTRTTRGIKEANFYILRATKCPAILTELGFMTSLEESQFMLRNTDLYVAALANAIHEIDRGTP